MRNLKNIQIGRDRHRWAATYNFPFSFQNHKKAGEKMDKLLNHSKLFLKRNASTILTCAGGAGVIATSVMAVKATPKALRLLEEAENEKGEELTKLEKVKTAGPAYIPTVLVGASAIACIFGANVLNKRKQAALMSAYALLDNSYKQYKDKVKELYGEDADEEIRSEIAKDHYKKSEHSIDSDKQLYYDDYSGRYFEATSEQVIRAQYKANKRLMENSGLYLNDYYKWVGLEPTDYGDYMGWSFCEMVDTAWINWLDFRHDKAIMDDGLEVTIISFGFEPTFDFENY
jgi:hypothetical protein